MRRRNRRESRLDPVRWRRPGRSALLRAAVVAALVVTAAVVMWTGPETCASSCRAQPGPVASPSRDAHTDRPPVVEPADRRPAVPPGAIGVPIRLAEPAALRLVHPGDHVDVFRVSGGDGAPQPVATAALVLGVTGTEDPGGGLLLALTPAEARRTITAPGSGYAVLIRPDG